MSWARAIRRTSTSLRMKFQGRIGLPHLEIESSSESLSTFGNIILVEYEGKINIYARAGNNLFLALVVLFELV